MVGFTPPPQNLPGGRVGSTLLAVCGNGMKGEVCSGRRDFRLVEAIRQGLGNEFGPVRVRVNVIPDEELARGGVTIEGAFDIADWDLTRGGNFPDGVVERS